MRWQPLAILSCLGFLLGHGACGGHDEAECDADQTARAESILALSVDEAAGEVAFGSSCAAASCHGIGGVSGPAPALSDVAGDFDDAGLACVLIAGAGDMPPQAGLDDQEMADVIAYVRANF